MGIASVLYKFSRIESPIKHLTSCLDKNVPLNKKTTQCGNLENCFDMINWRFSTINRNNCLEYCATNFNPVISLAKVNCFCSYICYHTVYLHIKLEIYKTSLNNTFGFTFTNLGAFLWRLKGFPFKTPPKCTY